MKQTYMKLSMLLLFLVVGLSAWAVDTTLASGTFNGKKAVYTTGWTTTGSGLNRTDCVIIGKDENITSPSIDFSQYDEVKITFTGRRFGTLTNSKATVEAKVNGTSLGTIDIANGTVGEVSGNISYSTNVASLGQNPVVFTCTNATSAGSTHGAGIGSITIVGVKNNTKAYTVTFDAGNNGSCTTTSLTETSAGAGVTLPSAKPNNGYCFDGWTATQGNSVPDKGCTAGSTYYPSANCTLYAVFSETGKPFTLVFKESGTDNDSNSKYDTKDLSNVFSAGSEYVKSISGLSNVYPAQIGRGAKLGGSSKTGELTINLEKAVSLGKIVVECAGYKDGEAGGFTINGTNLSSTTYAANGFEELTYNTTGSISAITIATQSKRGYVKSIKVYPSGSYADATISSAGWATFVSEYNTVPAEGVTAYAAKVNGSSISLTPVDAIPANTAVILKGEANTYTFDVTASAEEINTDLTYSTSATTANGTQYILAKKDDVVGFYKATPNTTIAANKGYFVIPASNEVKMLSLDETTSITDITSKSTNEIIYNLRGQRVDANYKGVVIKNGKKYYNK